VNIAGALTGNRQSNRAIRRGGLIRRGAGGSRPDGTSITRQ
jgi:hypothetical protein